MAVTYPLALPTITGRRRIQFLARDIVGETESPFSGSPQVFAWMGQMLRATVTLPPMRRASAAEWIAWLVALKGPVGSFLMGDPLGAIPRGVATGTPLVNGAHSAGAVSLVTDGWTISITNILRKMDWVQLGSGATSRIHMVLNDVNSDGSGNATLDIWPNLRTSVADNDPIVVSNTQTLWKLAGTDRGWDIDEASIYGIAFDCIEDLRGL